MPLDVVSAILFSPRGGSSHVARALARGLRAAGCSMTLVSGSRSGGAGDARDFYGPEVRAVDFSPALRTAAPLRYEGPPGTAPIHPSFEDRPGAPDAVFARLNDLEFERQVRAWARELQLAGAGEADVLHLHHLTPLHEAAARVAPHVPVVGHLHGTELLMLEQITAGPPPEWRYAARWAERLREWAGNCAALVASPAGVERAVDVLGVPREHVVALDGGVDVRQFAPRAVDRRRVWQRALVEAPRGWGPGGEPGSLRYTAADAAALADGTVLAYVGRFTAVKRIDLLIRAFARARQAARSPAGLVLIGGHPGEWEGEHPAELAERLGVDHVYLAGWYGQDELPQLLAAADAVLLASDHEQFGQALIEGMACELPAIATSSLGPGSIVVDGRTGWLVEPGDEAALAQALAAVIEDPAERRRRGRAARADVRERFAWATVTERLLDVLEEAAEGGQTAMGGRSMPITLSRRDSAV